MESISPEAPVKDLLSDKQILRYLIHLKFCCLSKGKFYLYDNIRVVFANRVPEGKDKLRNEIQLPEPKYSPFVAGSRSRRQSGASSPTLSPLSVSEQFELNGDLEKNRPSGPEEAFFSSTPIPFHMGRSLPSQSVPERTGDQSDDGEVETVSHEQDNHGKHNSEMQTLRPQSPEVYGFDRISTSQRGSPIPWATSLELAGRRSPSPALVTGDGLLSRRLREFGKQSIPSSSSEIGQATDGQ